MITKRQYQAMRHMIASRQGFRCFYCNCRVDYAEKLPIGQSDRAITLEHYVPRSQGGQDNPKDCVVSCKGCDTFKGSMHGDQYIALIARIKAR